MSRWPADDTGEPVKCGTFGSTAIPPEIRRRMDQDRAAADVAAAMVAPESPGAPDEPEVGPPDESGSQGQQYCGRQRRFEGACPDELGQPCPHHDCRYIRSNR
jgi:hypothetical protein